MLALLRVCWIPALLETAVLRRVGRVLPIVLAVALGRMALAVAGLGRVASVAWLRRMPAVALLGTSIALVRRRAAVALLRWRLIILMLRRIGRSLSVVLTVGLVRWGSAAVVLLGRALVV